MSRNDIKSTAVVKCSISATPWSYSRLAEHSDINSAPDNWLLGSYSKRDPLAFGFNAGSKDFSSFEMASSSLGCVGRVDVISDAENIKRLLKMPYSVGPQGRYSFPVPSLTREKLQNEVTTSKFFYHSIANDVERNALPLPVDDMTPGTFRSSQFMDPLDAAEVDPDLSLPPGDGFLPKQQSNAPPSSFERMVLWNFEDSQMMIGSDMPIFGGGTHPCFSLKLRDMKKPINVLTGLDYWLDQLMCNVPEVMMCYHLDGIVQKYEVVPTDELPSVSEEKFDTEVIRNVAQNILSFLKGNATKEGHTYWLFKGKDDDVVKLYDLSTICSEYMEKEDTNPFTVPVAILMYRVAKNLSEQYHSRKNSKKAANTIHKLLHDCLELLEKDKFPQIVGSIHYLLANLYLNYCSENGGAKSSTEESDTTADSVDDLFDDLDWFHENDFGPPFTAGSNKTIATVNSDVNSIKLVALTNANADGTRRALIREQSVGEEGTGPSSKQTPESTSTTSANNSKARKMPNSGNVEDCCAQALEHIYEGVVCADLMLQPEKLNGDVPTEAPAMADPSKPIPLTYTPLDKLLPLAVRRPLATSWQLDTNALLMVKAIAAYHMLAECSFKLQHYGKALRYLKQGFLCLESSMCLSKSAITKNAVITQCEQHAEKALPDLLVLCGDIHQHCGHQKAGHLAKHRSDLNSLMYRDQKIADAAKRILNGNGTQFEWCFDLSDSIERNLMVSQKCYEAAVSEVVSFSKMERRRTVSANLNLTVKPPPKTQQRERNSSARRVEMEENEMITGTFTTMQRLGSVKNELGVYYMNMASTLLSQSRQNNNGDRSDGPSDKIQNYWHQSFSYFSDGIDLFTRIGDRPNIALLNSNCGRLMRFCAYCYLDEDNEVCSQERYYTEKAINLYQAALAHISAKTDSPIWETISFELSSLYYSFAVQLQERPPISTRDTGDVEREICDLMQKSLRLVDQIDRTDNVKHTIYVYRAANIHAKLASMHHRAYLAKEGNERRVKHWKSLAELHFFQADDLYRSLLPDSVSELIRVQLERVSLVDKAAETMPGGPLPRLKQYKIAIGYILSLHTAFMSMAEKLSKIVKSHQSECNSDTDSILNDSGVQTIGSSTSKIIASDNTEKFEEYVNESIKLCRFAFERLQLLNRMVLQMALKSNDKTIIEQSKLSYQKTLVAAPSEPVQWPKIVLSVIEQLWGLIIPEKG